MSITRIAISVFIGAAVLCWGVSASASASTAGWFVNGSKLGTGSTVALASTAAVDGAPVLNMPALSIKITCTGKTIKISKGVIEGGAEPMGKAEELTIEGCSTGGPKTCELAIPEIIIGPHLYLVHLDSHIPWILFIYDGLAGPQLGAVAFNETNTCALAGEQPLAGKLMVRLPKGQDEEATQAVEALGSTENNSLQLGGPNKAYLEGGGPLLRLASGSKWGFHE